jgi:hypothetical protein
MPAPFNLDTDWQYLDGNEAVTLFRRQPSGNFDAGTVIPAPFALRITSKRRAGSDPRLAQRYLAWLLRPSSVGSPDPKVDDVIQDGTGTRWTVDEVWSYPLQSAFHLETIQELTT